MKKRLIFTFAAILTSIAVNFPIYAIGTGGDNLPNGAEARNMAVVNAAGETGTPAGTVNPSDTDSVKQATNRKFTIDKSSLGFGFGMDYGGIGGSILVYPQKNIGLFAGVGYAIAGAGFNAGIKYRILPKNPKATVVPFAMAMYGYNAAVHVKDAMQYDKLFYGPTFGIGLDIKASRKNKDYWTLGLLIPVRKPEVDDYIDDLKNNHGVEFSNDLIPVGISIGYRIFLN
jgi:hypothetical protein